MKAVYKFRLELYSFQTLLLPVEFKVLKLDVPKGIICLWVTCDADDTLQYREVYMYATGQCIPEHRQHLGSVLMCDGDYVWHFFI